MQIDLSQELQRPPPFVGYLEKKGSIRKNWKNRYFLLDGGTLRYFAKGPPKNAGSDGLEGVDMKGDVSLLGAEVAICEGNQLNLCLRGDKRPNMVLRAKSSKEVTEWHAMISKQIRYQNTLALHNQSRLPEVVEWYYQLQSELTRQHSFLLKKVEVHLSFDGSQTSGQPPSVFQVCMTEDRAGLLLSASPHAGRKANRMESLNNGRVIPLVDITGIVLPMQWSLTKDNRFPFVLNTKEDDLAFEMDAMGVPWLQAVRDMVLFARIPAPSGRSASVAVNGGDGYTMNTLIEFSANSGAVFALSNDVQLILENLSRVSSKSPVILEIGQKISTILKLIPDMRCNKEAGMAFGERIEEMTRVLGDGDVGILYLSRESDKSLLNFHLSTFNSKLNDVISFLTVLTRKNWLAASITSKQHDNAKLRFESFDADLINIVNTLIKAMSITQAVLFERRDYQMAVDVRRSVEALGGIEAIYHDAAKERALAKLIQSDGHEVHSELDEFIRNVEINMQTRTSRLSSNFSGYDSYRTSVDSSASQQRSFLSRLCCCCSGGDKKKADTWKAKSRKPRIQLEEPLVG